MAEGKPSTSRDEDTIEPKREASCNGADGSAYRESVPSFLTWIWSQILTVCSGLWGARGGGLLEPRVLGLASRAQQIQEASELEPRVLGLALGAPQLQEASDLEVLSRIAASRSTWSEVPGRDIHHSVPISCPSHLSVWEELKASAPSFFRDYSIDDLKVGRLIAEGGQAQIFEAKLKGLDKHYILKVFKLDAGFSLSDLKRHWPHSMRKRGEDCSESRSGQARSSGFVFEDVESNFMGSRCVIFGATLLEEGRFAFLMPRYWGDLRTLIDLKVKDNTHPQELDLLPRNRQDQTPFSYKDSIHIMSDIARGMQGLHVEGVLHRDLKAANVLINGRRGKLPNYLSCNVADYECAIFVQGTSFWRAPEVLQELQKKEEERNGEIWTEKVDVYSFGMTCYEILTGQIPFVGYTKSKWSDVIKGERPSLPDYVLFELRELVEACWHAKPSQRPSFEVIVEELQSLQGK